MRRAARVDGNHAAIVKALRKIGCMVLDLSKLGRGVPDLLVARRFTIKFLEIKNPETGGALNEAQREWHDQWRGHVLVVESPEQAVREMCR